MDDDYNPGFFWGCVVLSRPCCLLPHLWSRRSDSNILILNGIKPFARMAAQTSLETWRTTVTGIYVQSRGPWQFTPFILVHKYGFHGLI